MVADETGFRRRKERKKRVPKPLDTAATRDLALSYVARFATSSAKLTEYLHRKLRERGVPEDEPAPDVAAIVERIVELGYVDDAAYARNRAGGLLRRGYGERRVEQALWAAGIDEEVRSEVAPNDAAQRLAAFTLAKKRRFGPFGSEEPDQAKRQKQISAMLRAGHGFDAARALVDARTVEKAQGWLGDAEVDE